MRTPIACSIFAALAAVPGVGLAEFNYTGLDISYVDVDRDVGSGGDGFAFGGTFTVAESFFLGGGYEDYDFDSGADGEIIELGGGYFHPINDGMDFVASLAIVDMEVSSGSFSADDDAIAIGGGIRFEVSPEFQLDAMVEYVDWDNSGSDTGFEFRGRYYFSDDIALGAQIDLGKDVETFRIGIRFEF